MLSESLRQKALELGTPLACTIELLAACNLRCSHCYVTHSRKSVLSLARLCELFRQLADAGVFGLTLTGGEIGLRPDLFEIVREARRHHFSVSLLTSGTLWTEREWDAIADLDVSLVRVSVYSARPQVHDTITGRAGSFARTMASVRGLLARGVNVAIACSVLRSNAAQVGDVVDLGDGLGAAVTIDPVITPTDSGGCAPCDRAASNDQLVALYRQLRARTGSGLESQSESTAGPASRPCHVGFLGAFLRCSGDVFPCADWPESAGNILGSCFLDIWQRSPVFARARAITTRDLTGCASCAARTLCTPCVALNLVERGSYHLPSPTVCARTMMIASTPAA